MFIVVVINATTVAIVVCHNVRVLECCCDDLTHPVLEMMWGLILAILGTHCPIHGHETHDHIIGFFNAKQMKIHTIKLTWQCVREPNFFVHKMRCNCFSINVLWPLAMLFD
jgi:hypothetical protein